MPTLGKNLLVLLCISLLLAGKSLAQMRQVYFDNTNPDNEISKISFYSPTQGYVAFRDWIGFTADSGRTFSKKPITLNNVDYNGYGVNLTFGFGINGVKAFSQDTLLAYGDYGLVPAILYSTNGGNSFKLIYHSQFNSMQLRTGIMDMIFPQNGSTGYAVDADRILKTVDRGKTWSLAFVDQASYLDQLQAVDDNNVYAFSTVTSKFYRTNNAGGFWAPMNLPAGQQPNSAYFLTPSKAYLNSSSNADYGRTYYTSDGGATWTLKNTPLVTPFQGYHMHFVNDSVGYALSGLFDVYKTSDSGKIWERLPRDNSFEYLGYSFNDLHFRNSSQFWAGGGYGFLEMTTNGGGLTILAAHFKIDTTGIIQTNVVKLFNYSKPGYQCWWIVNNSPIGTGYNASYTHDVNSLDDSIQLIISNGTYADTLVQHQHFFPPVLVTSFSPTAGAAGTVVTINGKNFRGATSVSFGGSSASSFTVLSDTVIRATVGGGSSGSVRVVTPTGAGSLAGFSFIPPPIITSFTPAYGIAGDVITITGQNFNNVTAVYFGGVPAASFTVQSTTQLQAVLGVGASGAISVTAMGGTGSKTGFASLPNLTSFTPASGTHGTYMTINGTGFAGVVSVTVGNQPVDTFIVNSAIKITAVVSTGATGDVMVTSNQGASSRPGFTYYDAPVIRSYAPALGAVGTAVTITGSNFNPVPVNNTVYFGAVKATVVSGTSTSLVVQVPTGATYHPITVTSNNLTAYSSQPFVVTFPNGGSITANSFATRFDLNTGTDYTALDGAIGDVDGDGKPDLLVINRGYYVIQTAVSVFRNTSTGGVLSFAPRVDYFVPDPGGLALADFDGDGMLDFAVTDGDAGKVAFFRNASTPGNISFEPRVDISSARMGGQAAVQDIDDDGKLDIIFSSWWEGQLAIHRNISNPGSLAFGPRITIQGGSERNMELRDLDGDGKPELVTSGAVYKNTSSKLRISFGPAAGIPSYTHSYLAVGDLDKDGQPDIVIPEQDGSQIALLRSLGGLNFAPPKELSATENPAEAELADLDGDGLLDIAASLRDHHLGLFKNTSSVGSFSFAPVVNYGNGPVSSDNHLAIGDLDGDGKPEIVVFSEMQRSVGIFMNNVKKEPFVASFTPSIGSAGTVVSISGRNFSGSTAVTFGGVAAASFTVNSDTLITAVVGNGGSGSVSVTNRQGTGVLAGFSFGIPPVITNFSPKSGQAGSSVVITGANFSADASANLVSFGSVRATVTAATVNSLTVTVPAGSLYQPISVTTGNLTAYSNGNFLVTLSNGGLGFAPGSFSDALHFPQQAEVGTVGDLDGDGLLDVVRLGTSTVEVSRNTKTADSIHFAAPVQISLAGSPARVALGDVDGDGKPDIIVSSGPATVSVLLNNSTPGNLAFLARKDFSTGWSASGDGLQIRDLDKDGKPEIIVASYDAHTVTVYKNLSTPGNVSFDQKIDYLTDGYPTDLRVEDVDGDGAADLVVSVNGTQEISVFLNTSAPNKLGFALKQDFPVNSWPESLVVGDMNGDGKADIAVANLNGQSVSILKNNSSPGSLAFIKTDIPVNHPWMVWLNDLDGDGKPELGVQKEAPLTYYSNEMAVELYKNTSTLGGSISFDPPYDLPAGEYGRKSWSADMDADGKADVLVYSFAGPQGSTFVIYRNRSNEGKIVEACVNSNAVIVSNLKAAAYQWQQNTGNGFVNLANNATVFGVTTDTLKLFNIPQSSNGYRYRCIAGGDTTVVFVLSMNALPLADAGADKSICRGVSNGVSIGTSTVAGNTYAWSPTTGMLSPGVAQPFVTPQSTIDYVLTVTNSHGCVAKDTVKVTVLTQPTAAITASATTICIGQTVSLSSSASTGNQWYLNGTAIPGATNQTYTGNVGGTYSLIVSQNGCSSTQQNIYITAMRPPSVPTIAAAGATAFCEGKSVVLNSSDTGTHQWYRDGAPIQGAVNPTFTASQSGNYTVVKTNGICNSAPSASIAVAVSSVPAPAITVSGSTTICGGDNVLLSSSAATGNQWYRNDSVITGASRANYLVQQGGRYSVRYTSNGCVSTISAPVVINVSAIPPAPVITLNNSVLVSSSATGNQWYLNGTAISGANDRSYTVIAGGDYTARLTANGCSGPFSNTIHIAVMNGLSVGPNPVTGTLVLRYPGNTDLLVARLLDANGNVVFNGGQFTTYYEIDMSRLMKGTYIVEVTNTATGVQDRRLIIKM